MMSAVDNSIIWSMSWECLGQHLGPIVNNGQQSAVLHESVMPFLSEVKINVTSKGIVKNVPCNENGRISNALVRVLNDPENLYLYQCF